MMSRFDNNRMKAKSVLDQRVQDARNEKKVKDLPSLLLFSFKDYDSAQCPPGQNFEDWEKDKLLSSLMVKLVDLSQKNIIEATQQKLITVYGEFPDSSEFKIPKYIQGEVDWAAIKNVGGQKHRVAGYIKDNVFYVVFLDKNHKFYKMKKK